MEKELNKIRKNSIIEISSWGGLSLTPGTSGTIITKDYYVYRYHQYHRVPTYLEDKIPLEYLSKPIKLNDKTINNINKFIEENILNKEFEEVFILDASFHLTIKHNNQTITINNYPNLNSKLNRIIERGINNEKEQ